MSREEREYSIAELLEPAVEQAMRTQGIERRSLELLLEEMRGGRRRDYPSRQPEKP